MKNTYLFYILLCLFTLSGLVSCEKAEIQKSLPKDNVIIDLRADDCEDCEDCCCSVLLTGVTSSVNISLCGTANLGTEPCSWETDFCQVASGTIESFTLTTASPKHDFCMSPGNAFSITGSPGVSVTLICYNGQTNPPQINLTFGANPKNFYSVNAECEIEDDCL